MSTLIPFIFGVRLGPAYTKILLSGFIAFLASTWEEWHTGVLYLGVVSGPVEGAWSLALSALITGLCGSSEIWTIPRSVFGFKPFPLNELAVGMFVLGSGITVVTSCIHVIEKSGFGAIKHLIWPLVFFVACWAVAIVVPEVYASHANFYWFTFFCGLPTCLRVSSTIVNYVTKSPLPSPHFLELFPFILMIAKWLNDDVMMILKFLTLVSGVVYARFVFLVIGDLCGYLNINCLTIKKKSAQ